MDYKNIKEVKEIDYVIDFIKKLRRKYIAEIQAEEKNMGGILSEIGNKLRGGIVDLENKLVDELKDRLNKL